MRPLLLLITVSFAGLGCSGWKAIERSDWEVVWDQESVKKPAEAKARLLQGFGGFGQEVITREKYDEEIAGGTRRKVEPLPGVKPSLLTELDGKVTLAVGELRTFRIDEVREPVLTWSGNGLEVFLTEARRVDGWKDHEAVDGRESYLHLVGTKAGKAKLQLVQGTEKLSIDVTVTAAAKK